MMSNRSVAGFHGGRHVVMSEDQCSDGEDDAEGHSFGEHHSHHVHHHQEEVQLGFLWTVSREGVWIKVVTVFDCMVCRDVSRMVGRDVSCMVGRDVSFVHLVMQLTGVDVPVRESSIEVGFLSWGKNGIFGVLPEQTLRHIQDHLTFLWTETSGQTNLTLLVLRDPIRTNRTQDEQSRLHGGRVCQKDTQCAYA